MTDLLEIDRKTGFGTRGLKTLLFLVYPLLGLLVVPLALAGARQGFKAYQLFSDPAAELGPLWGVFSYFGILMWTAAASALALGWAVLVRAAPTHPSRTWLLASALISAGLTIDDTFVIHDYVLPKNVGIPELVVQAAYLIGLLWYLFRFRRDLFGRDDSALFLASLLFLGMSFGIDVTPWTFPLHATAEDLSKLLGITAWAYFFVRVTLDVITKARPATT